MDYHNRTGSYICVSRYKRLVINLNVGNFKDSDLQAGQRRGQEKNHFLFQNYSVSL